MVGRLTSPLIFQYAILCLFSIFLLSKRQIALYSPCRSVGRLVGRLTSPLIFSIYTGIKALYKPSTTQYQSVPSDNEQVPPSYEELGYEEYLYEECHYEERHYKERHYEESHYEEHRYEERRYEKRRYEERRYQEHRYEERHYEELT